MIKMHQRHFFYILLPLIVACGSLTQRKSFYVDQEKRIFIVDLPKTPSDKDIKNTTDCPRPVLYVLHGNPSNATLMRKYTGLDETTSYSEFIIVHLSAQKNRWAYKYDTAKIQNEITYLDRVIDLVDSSYNTDTSKRFLVGFSGGGFFISQFLSQSENQVHGVALVGSTLMRESRCLSNYNNVIPWLLIIGTEDPFYNGTLFSQPADSSVMYLVKANNCSTTPQIHKFVDTNKSDSSSVRDNYFSSKNGNDVWYVEITNGGHHWPNAVFNPNFLFPKSKLGNLNRDFDTNKYLIAFFEHCLSTSDFNIELNLDTNSKWNVLGKQPEVQNNEKWK
ncbi:MAG: poly(3-hydroxybutyrate) depolymerase [bacterium]|jgi:poly(3-hydroxybutyrate) depolymerase